MKTSLKSSGILNFRLREHGAEKNGLHRSPINDDLPSVNTWGTPQIGPFPRRSHHHDA
jgi:hypothetical protein